MKLALTYGATISSGAAAWLGLGQGQLEAAAAVAFVALLFAAIRLNADGVGLADVVPPARRVTGSPAVRRVATVAVAGAVVSSVVMSGALGPAVSPVQEAKADWSSDCDFTDSLIGAAYNTLIGADSGCHWDAGDKTDTENLTQTDAHANALALKDSADSYVTTTGNFMQNTRTVAMSKAKITLINELNNGSGVAQANNAVNQTGNDYYARMENQIVADWNAKATQVEYLQNSSGDLTFEVRETSLFTSASYLRTVNLDYTLVNGTTVSLKAIEVDSSGATVQIVPFKQGSGNPFIGRVKSTDSTGNTATILNSTDYDAAGNDDIGNTGLLEQVNAQQQYVIDNMDPYVDEVYNQYNAGEINGTDLALNDPSVIAQEASTSLNSTGYYGHAAIMLASLGSAGNVNVSHTIETGDGTVLNGTLYYTADDAPADGWQTGTTYNVTDYNGTFYMAVAKDNGNATIVDLSNYGQEWTITEATNTQTGDEVNATKVNTYTYDSTNASALEEEIDRLKELRRTYESQDTGGGGGWFEGIGIGGVGLPVVAAAAAILYLRD